MYFIFRKTLTLGFCAITLALLTLSLSSCNRSTEPLITRSLDNLETQEFSMNVRFAEVISCKEGSIFAIPKHAFMDSTGKIVSGRIDIHVKEANTLSSMFLSGLQTRTQEGLLSTNGSYLFEAFKNGSRLELAPGKEIYSFFPTDEVDPEMNLYTGEIAAEQVAWTLTDAGQSGIRTCDGDKKTRKECKKCRTLISMSKNLKTGEKPKENDYWVDRYYWENGTLYFASSGSSSPILSNKNLEDCREYLKTTKAGLALLAKVEEIKQQQLSDIGGYYNYRLTNLGWHNIDKLIKADLVAFNGTVVDKRGRLVEGASVHLYSKKLNVHIYEIAEDGNFEFNFLPDESFKIYAYKTTAVGKEEFEVSSSGENVGALTLERIGQDEVDAFLADLM